MIPEQFYKYPHTDLNQQNQDWLIAQTLANTKQVEDMQDVVDNVPSIVYNTITDMIAGGVITVDTTLRTFTGIGLVGDGTTDNSSAFNVWSAGLDGSVVTVIFMDAGTFRFASSLTIPAYVYVVGVGGVIAPDAGVTVAMNGHFEAPCIRCFAGAGTVDLSASSGENYVVYPEWWGAKNDGTTDSTAAIQAAVNAITRGKVVLQPGSQNYDSGSGTWQPSARCYVITAPIEIRRSYIDVGGPSVGSKAVIYRNTTPFILLGTGNGGTRIEETTVHDLKLIYSGATWPAATSDLDYHTTYAMEIFGLERGTVSGITVMGTPNAYVISHTVSCRFQRMNINPAVGNSYSIGRGYWIDNSVKNWSMYMDHCGGGFYAGLQSGVTGMYIDGPVGGSATDMFFHNLEIVNADIALECAFALEGYNILFENAVFDQCHDQCLKLDAVNATHLRFTNSYFQHNASSGNAAITTHGQYAKFFFSNCHFRDAAKTVATIKANGTTDGQIFVSDSVFQDCGYCANVYSAWISGCYFHNTGNTALTCMLNFSNSNGGGNVTGCRFQNQSGTATLDYYIGMQQYIGCVNNTFSGTHTAYVGGGTNNLWINNQTAADNKIPGFNHA